MMHWRALFLSGTCLHLHHRTLEHEAIAPIQRLHANLLFMVVEVGILWDCSPFSSSLVLVLSSTRYGFTSTFLCLFNTFD